MSGTLIQAKGGIHKRIEKLAKDDFVEDGMVEVVENFEENKKGFEGWVGVVKENRVKDRGMSERVGNGVGGNMMKKMSKGVNKLIGKNVVKDEKRNVLKNEMKKKMDNGVKTDMVKIVEENRVGEGVGEMVVVYMREDHDRDLVVVGFCVQDVQVRGSIYF